MKPVLSTTNDYKKLFLENTPLLDVRAPIEFEKGAFPCAENHPIINDIEREVIGTKYKENGGDAAVKLGKKLVSGDIKAARLKKWKKFIETHPDGALYCFRGGMRSRTSQQWIYDEFGIDYPLITGGYKAMRNFLIETLNTVDQWIKPIRIGGRTGVGKTQLLLKLKNQIDLEGIANHRGSSFGKRVHPQPTQINFENHLAVELLKKKQQGLFKIYLEDEGRQVGRVSIPEKCYMAFRSGPLVVLDIPVDARVDLTFDEYITAALLEYQKEYGEKKGFEAWRQNIENSLENIQKRLGGVRYQALKKEVVAAMETQQKTGNAELHKPRIKTLLVEYYDPMYDYHIAKSDDQIIFRGNEKEVLDFLKKTKG